MLDLVAEGFHAGDGSWVGFSGRKRVLVFNPEITDESELPTTVLDLVKPEWKGRIGVAPSNASFQDFVTAMRFKIGDEATAAWLKGIADNDAFTFANNAAIVAAVGRGEVEVGLVNHYYVYQALAQDPEFAGDQPQLRGRRHRKPGDRHRGLDAEEQRQSGSGRRADPIPAAGGGTALLL